jgi:hypothetical protein
VIRRLFWLGTGFGLGVAASIRVHRSASQLAPAALAERLREDVQAAIGDGRQEMQAREATMRALLATSGSKARNGRQ